MSKCYSAPFTMPAAGMGKENPLPDIKNISYIHAGIETTPAVPRELQTYINRGMISTMLPYLQQDGYDRCRRPRTFQSVVVENEYLKAIFLPELGGRLWSLVDRTTGRELLYRNPVFQPGNLALRNAWFSGGVEFNVSIKGHNPLTCDPLFAQKITLPDGSEGLRMFEYERIRGVLYSIDAWIPEGSRFLYLRPRIENRTGKEIWMYWWSNIAVPAHPHTRVIAPASKTFINYFGNDHYILDYADYPHALGTDISYPENLSRSLDFFYHIPDPTRKWIAAVDETGYGLQQCSTPEMKGRKLFLWGQGDGGKNWNQFLSDGSNNGYIEIQAGLARTQLEHLPMQDRESWCWVEVYGAVQVDAHGELEKAKEEIAHQLESPERLAAAKNAPATAGEFLQYGSGWGVLEQLYRPLSTEIILPEAALGTAQQEWLTLLREGILPEADPAAEPAGYQVGEHWFRLLQKSSSRHWYALMHLGVMHYARGELQEALACFEKSVQATPNAWSLRNIAMIRKNEFGDPETACGYMEQAFALCKTCRGILLDTAATYLAAGKYQKWLDTFAQAENFRSDGRLKLCTAKALMGLKRYREAAALLNKDLEMPDIQEGDTAISDLWFTLYGALMGTDDPQSIEEQYPLGALDFRMH